MTSEQKPSTYGLQHPRDDKHYLTSSVSPAATAAEGEQLKKNEAGLPVAAAG